MAFHIKKYNTGFRVVDATGTPLSKRAMSYTAARKQQIAASHARLRGGSKGLGNEEYALSDEDINKLLDGTKIFRYPDLRKLGSIDEAFDELGRCMILYLTQDENTGHWVCLLRRDGNVIEYFDSYGGYKPDDERKWLSKEQLVELGQDEPILTKMLHGYTVKSNPYKLQGESERGRAINTCGRHCVTRLLLGHLPIGKYAALIKSSGVNPDDFVTTFTFEMLHK
jgi:hypothetical protein